MTYLACAFTIVIVTASVQSLYVQTLTDSEAVKKVTKYDAQDDRRVDEDSRRNQMQWFIRSVDDQKSHGRAGQAMQVATELKEKLNLVEQLILQNQKTDAQRPLQISLHPSEYNDNPQKKRNPTSDKSLKSAFLKNLFQAVPGNQGAIYLFGTKGSSETLRTTRNPYVDNVDPGDGEGWYNYPITKPDAPNPAWHLSTLRWYYKERGMQRSANLVRRIFKRSPKRICKKKKKTRDERKKFNKKKKCRRKQRILISKKDKPKVKKGDGSYRGGRGRKKKMRGGPKNQTLLMMRKKLKDFSVEKRHKESEGPVADAYIDYDSSYIPPSDEQNEKTKSGEDGDDDEDDCDDDDDEEGSGDDEDDSCEDEEEEGSGDDDNLDSDPEDLMSEAYEPSGENNNGNEKTNTTKSASRNDKHKETSGKNLNKNTNKMHPKRTELHRRESDVKQRKELKKENVKDRERLFTRDNHHKYEKIVPQVLEGQRENGDSILLQPFDGMIENAMEKTQYNHNMKSLNELNHFENKQSKNKLKPPHAMEGSLSDIADNLQNLLHKNDAHSKPYNKLTHKQLLSRTAVNQQRPVNIH